MTFQNPRAQDGDHGYRNHQVGQRQEAVRETHEDGVYPASGHTADQSYRCAYRPGKDYGHKADRYGYSGAIDDPAEDVPAQVVGTQQVFPPSRLLQDIRRFGLDGVEWRNPGSEDSDDDDYGQVKE